MKSNGFLLTDEGRGPAKLGYVGSAPGSYIALRLPMPAAGRKTPQVARVLRHS